MAGAFQQSAFQNNAFQVDTTPVACTPAFQRNAFQNNAFQVCAETENTNTGGGGRRRPLPQQFEAPQQSPTERRRIKPVRPIWDRGPPVTPVEPLPSATPTPDTVVAFKAPPTGPADLSNLARLLDPQPPKPRTAQSKLLDADDRVSAAANASTFARAQLDEAADTATASGHVATQTQVLLFDTEYARATVTSTIEAVGLLTDADLSSARVRSTISVRGAFTEDGDELSAYATWDDDDLALALLLDDDEFLEPREE